MKDGVLPGTVATAMPYQWSGMLLRDPRVVKSTLLTGLSLATYGKMVADSPVFPSGGRVAVQTGLSRQTVSQRITRLAELGYLTKANRRAYAEGGLGALLIGDQRVNAWLLTLPSHVW